MEGKETRFGIAGSVLAAWASKRRARVVTDAIHDSFTPLGGAVPLIDMLLGDIVFGGLGTGLYRRGPGGADRRVRRRWSGGRRSTWASS